MSSRKDLRRHADLLDRMATNAGVNLQDAAISGTVSVDEITDAVLRCSDCPNPEHCESLLQRSEAVGSIPEYCRNRDMLKKLVP